MKAWLVTPDADPVEIAVTGGPNTLTDVSRAYFDGAAMDMTRVRYEGRLVHMAVDDDGHYKGLEFNKIATDAYRANCYPGTAHWIAGPAVIFSELLP